MENPPPARPEVVTCDVSGFTLPDERALDVIARLQLLARRLGATVRLVNAGPELVELITWAGLSEVLTVVPADVAASGVAASGVAASGVEMEGQIEQRKQVGIDEEVLGDDDAV